MHPLRPAHRQRAKHAYLLGVCSATLALHGCVTSTAGGEASTSTAPRPKPRELSTFEQRWQSACEPNGQLGGEKASGWTLYVCDEADTSSPAFCSGDVDDTNPATRAALAGLRPELRACLRGAEPQSWVRVGTTCACAGTGSPGLSARAVSCVTALVRQALSDIDTGAIDKVVVMHMPGAATPVEPEASGDHIRAVVRGHIGEVRACYNDALGVWPSLVGRTELRFVIGPDGRVWVVATKESSLHNPALECCINTAVHGWRFPKPEGGGIVVVNYPFVLEQTQ